MSKQRSCTKKQSHFVELWLKTGSMVEGYKGAYNTRMTGPALAASAKKLGRLEHVRALYEERKAGLDRKAREVAEEKHGVTIDLIMREHKAIGFANILDYITIGPDGRPFTDFSRLTRAQAVAIGELTEETVALDAAGTEPVEGDRKPKVAVVKTRFKLSNKQASLIEMGKHLGMYEADSRQKAEAEAEAHIAAAQRSNDDLARRVALVLANGARRAAKAAAGKAP